MLLNLGKYSDNKKLFIEFGEIGTYSYDSIELISINFDDYIEDVNNLNKGVSKIEYTKDKISCTVDLMQDSFLQLNTGYSKGWKVYIDGKEAKTYKSNIAFVGTNVKKGVHNIVFVYKTPYYKYSLVATAVGLASYAFVIWVERKKIF